MEPFRYMKTDTPSIMFSALSTRSWGRTFRFTAFLKEDVCPEVLKRAVSEVLPQFPGVALRLKKGFFWAYQVGTRHLPEIREEDDRPLHPITYRHRNLPDFRLVYRGKSLSLEASHSLGDGKGMMKFFSSLLERYVYLIEGGTEDFVSRYPAAETAVDAYDTYYDKKGAKPEKKKEKAFHFPEECVENYLSLSFLETDEDAVKALAHGEKMTVTEFISCVLILAVLHTQAHPGNEKISVAVPVNLRRFFPSGTGRNFVTQTQIPFYPKGRQDIDLQTVCEETRGLLRQQITPEELKKSITKFGALKRNPILRIVPYFIKKPVLAKMQKHAHDGVTTIFTNLGETALPEETSRYVTGLRFINGDTGHYGLPVTCSCVTYQGKFSLCFSNVRKDDAFFDETVKILRGLGLTISTEVISGSGALKPAVGEKEKTRGFREKLKGYFNV